jgi:hypothetical protein
MLLAAMVAMVMVAAAPAFAQIGDIQQYSDDDTTTINTICNQVLGIAAEQTQYGDANAAAVDESEAAAAAANELDISVDQALACFDSNAAAGDDNVVGDVEDDVVGEEVVGVVGVDDDADGAVDEADGSEAVVVAEEADDAEGVAVLPDTGGASLLTLGAGALLVGGGLLARRIFR